MLTAQRTAMPPQMTETRREPYFSCCYALLADRCLDHDRKMIRWEMTFITSGQNTITFHMNLFAHKNMVNPAVMICFGKIKLIKCSVRDRKSTRLNSSH